MLSIFKRFSSSNIHCETPMASASPNLRYSILAGKRTAEEENQASIDIISVVDSVYDPQQTQQDNGAKKGSFVITNIIKRYSPKLKSRRTHNIRRTSLYNTEDDAGVSDCDMTEALDAGCGAKSLEGAFAVLPTEMRLEIFNKWLQEKDWKTLMNASRVNSRWNREITELWRAYFESATSEGLPFTTDEELWFRWGKSWKWICIVLHKRFGEDDKRNGLGCNIARKRPVIPPHQQQMIIQQQQQQQPFPQQPQQQIVNNVIIPQQQIIPQQPIIMNAAPAPQQQQQQPLVMNNNNINNNIAVANANNGNMVVPIPPAQQQQMNLGDAAAANTTTPTNPNEISFDGVYQGEWKNNKRENLGRLCWSNKDRYLGEWKSDRKHGYGYMMWANGDRYAGHWKDDLRHGSNALYFYNVGGEFRGTYVRDERHGSGEYRWPDGDRYVGEWRHGGRFGKGVFITRDGTRVSQLWNEDTNVSYSQQMPEKYPPIPVDPTNES